MHDILIWGLDDWVDLGFARQYVSDEIGPVSPDELREQTLRIVSDLLDAGLFTAGDLSRAGFAPWPTDPAETVTRLRATWDVPEAPLYPGDLGWLQITEDGQALARRLIRGTGSRDTPSARGGAGGVGE